MELMEKIKSVIIPCEQNYVAWLVKNDNSFQQTHAENSFASIRQVGKEASKHLPQSSFLRIFALGKCLMDSKQIILIFIEVWDYNFHVSR